jgi:hypothetical protein
MSYDFNTSLMVCDHSQSNERYIISPSDLRTLNYVGNTAINQRAPINGTDQVKVYIQGNLVNINDSIYGYQVIKDTNRILEAGVIFYKIVFNREVRLFNPLIEVSYLTQKLFCLKCNGIGRLNNFEQNSGGVLAKIGGNLKLYQRALKFILTSRCAFYPSFTCRIKDFIGQKYGFTITDSDIASEVTRVLDSMKQIQLAQRTIQTLDLPEILKDIVSVSADLDPNDPTLVNISATVSSYSGQTMPLNFSLKATS